MAHTWAMSRDEPHQMRIRISKELHAELEAEASKKSISINSEVISRLQGGHDNARKDAYQAALSELMETQINLLSAHLGISIHAVRMLLISIRDRASVEKDDLEGILKDSQEAEQVMTQVLSRWRKERPLNALSLELLQSEPEPEVKRAAPARKSTKTT